MDSPRAGGIVPAMDVFWEVVTIGSVVATIASLLWAFVIAPFWTPHRTAHR